MSRRLRIFLTLVGVAAAALLGTHVPPAFGVRWAHYVAWVVICLVSETMWSESLSGSATWSLAATAGLAAVVLWGTEAGMWVSALSTWIADLFLARKPWVRAAFNSSQIALTSWLAGTVFALLGGRSGLPLVDGAAVLDRAGAAALVLPFAALMLVYFVLNRAFVSAAVAWSSTRRWWQVLRDDWLYVAKLEVDAASFLLVPLMVISFTAVGYPGVLLFYAPLFMLFQSDRRFHELKHAEEQNLRNAAFAAKGEIAAGIGHNLKSKMVGVTNFAQMIVRDLDKGDAEEARRHTQLVIENAKTITEVGNWLQDYNRAAINAVPVDLNKMLLNTIELVKGDARLRGVEWDLDLDPRLPELRADAAHVQDVFMNLFLNAADAMGAQETRKAIAVSTEHDTSARGAVVHVSDTGPGILPENLPRMFRPLFTTKGAKGHGFGLSTAQRSIESHGGKISVDSPPGSGAQFTIQLPLSGPAA